MNLPICTGVTALTLDSGEVVILEFGFISYFYILFTNHKPFPNSNITTSPESSVKAVTPVHIGKFICSAYHGRNVDTVKSSKVNDTGRKLAPNQWVSA